MHDLGDDYFQAGFGGRLAFGARPALLIIDVVKAYLEPDSPLYCDVGDAVEWNARLAAAARKRGMPVIFTRVEYSPGGVEGGLFYRKVPAARLFEKGSPLGEFPEELIPEEGDLVVTKHYPSAFFGTSLASTLRVLEVDTLLLTGFSTSGCVRASALDAIQHGFIPFVVRDACGDRDSRPHDGNLFDMQAKMAEVIRGPEALELLAPSAQS
jgi:maleamate amidohydrolase